MKQRNSKFAAMDGFSGSLDDAYAHGVLMATETRSAGTCENCKHWEPVHGDCENSEVIAFIENGNGGLFRPPAGWGCNHWEAK